MTAPRHSARRDRQLREIAALVAGGAQQRAAGLALEHLTCFPQDADVLADSGAITDQHAPALRTPCRAPEPSDRTSAKLMPRPPEPA